MKTSCDETEEKESETFDARIDLTGLFRFCPTDDGKRLTALAPWTGPVVDQKRHVFVHDHERHFHRLMVGWWPHDLGDKGMPLNAMSLWQVLGMELEVTFEREDAKPPPVPSFAKELKELRIPSMVDDGGVGVAGAANTANRPRSIVPKGMEEAAKVRPALLERKAGKFEPLTDLELGLTTHLGFLGNKQGLSGRVIIKEGALVTDDFTSVESVFLPSLYDAERNTEPCRGFFTNQVSVIANKVKRVTIEATNLITGKPAGKLTLAAKPNRCQDAKVECDPKEPYLLVSIMHLCPATLLAECPDPMVKAKRERDEDFRYLYELSESPKKLLRAMRRSLGYCSRRLPVPTRPLDHHSCSPSRCGSCRN